MNIEHCTGPSLGSRKAWERGYCRRNAHNYLEQNGDRSVENEDNVEWNGDSCVQNGDCCNEASEVTVDRVVWNGDSGEESSENLTWSGDRTEYVTATINQTSMECGHNMHLTNVIL